MPETRDPGAAIKRLAERLEEEATKAGLTLRGFTFAPNMGGDGPHMVQAVFSLEGDIEPEDPAAAEQARIDAEFERMLQGDKIASEVDKVAEARRLLEARLAEGSSILDDEND